ncbi:MAG: fibronectin type III domain-containing protein [Rikenellaceae bacterium]|nr:fibronectin type III domain-containing protein [Rikenellaceae bacterium]
MKNIFKMVAVAAVALFALGCETTNEGPKEGQLATPEFTCSVTGNAIMVSWEAVEGAAYYEITISNKATQKTDNTVYRFEDLEYNTEYTIKLQAISTDESKNSQIASQKVTTDELKALQYREWYPKNGAAATAISNNGRWVVGGNDRSGFVLDLSKEEMVEFSGVEFFDVADDGTAVGASFETNQDGTAAILIGDKMVEIDLSSVAVKHGMSCATGITPDATYIVGWFWEYDEANSYFAQQYGAVVPFCYDVLKDRVIVPTEGERIYNENAATAIKAVAPDRTLLGYQQSQGIHSIIWADENTPYEYVHFEYNDDYEPVFSLGDTQNLFTQSGRYIYGKATDFANGQASLPAVYDRETKELYTFTGGSVSAMSDQGVAFINDAPYYLGTTSYVVDINKGEPYEQIPFEEWIFDEHNVDIASFHPSTDETDGDNLYMEAVITIGVSEDGTKFLGITNTMQGWLTYVVDINGEPAPEQ